MNWKKIILLLVVFLTFLGTGVMLSNVQSREANQLIEAHGMSNNTRYLDSKHKETVSSFLCYLSTNFKKNRIGLHLDNKHKDGQVLVWANRQVIPLSTESGRYFYPDDFQGQVSFAVIGPDPKVKRMETQGNTYLIINKRYYSVIGQLKNYHNLEKNKYYLSTGIKQPTARDSLRHYRIVMDASDKVITKVARHYHAQIKIPAFVHSHQIHRFSIIKEIFLILLFWLLAAFCNALIAVMEWRQVNFTHLKGELLRNWFINRGSRLILIESVLAIFAYFFLRGHAFFRRSDHLIELLILNWLIAVGAYLWYLIRLRRKEKKIV